MREGVNMKNKDKILEVLMEKSPMQKQDIVAKSGVKASSSGAFLKQLVKKGDIENMDYGEYKITEQGKSKAEQLKQKYGKYTTSTAHSESKSQKKDYNSSDEIIEDFEKILALKTKYSENKKMLDMIKKIFQ